jgi:hypothetical protein
MGAEVGCRAGVWVANSTMTVASGVFCGKDVVKTVGVYFTDSRVGMRVGVGEGL